MSSWPKLIDPRGNRGSSIFTVRDDFAVTDLPPSVDTTCSTVPSRRSFLPLECLSSSSTVSITSGAPLGSNRNSISATVRPWRISRHSTLKCASWSISAFAFSRTLRLSCAKSVYTSGGIPKAARRAVMSPFHVACRLWRRSAPSS